MIQSDLRAQFLQSWQPYPIGVEGVCVRVVSVQNASVVLEQDGGEPGALLLSDGNWALSARESRPWRASFTFRDLQQTLRPGDWLCIFGKPHQPDQWTASEVDLLLLLAPNRHPDFIAFQQQTQVVRWSRFVEDVRRFFLNEGFVSIETPHLVPSSGLEPHLEPFVTTWKSGSRQRELFLPTSPELHLKKLLCRGFRKIFEIKKVFRNEDSSPHHQPEFLMLEWYRAMATLDTIEEDISSLLHFLRHKGWGSSLPTQKLERLSVRELFARFLNIELEPDTSAETLRAAAQGLAVNGDFSRDTFDDLFHRLWIDFIDPQLKTWPALIVSDYPPSQAALARLTPNGWADRRELYLNGVEIANGYFELNDPDEQRRRFESDEKLRAQLGRTPVSIDADFLKHLEQGMPPSAGIALGVERLFMALEGLQNLNEFLPFPHKN